AGCRLGPLIDPKRKAEGERQSGLASPVFLLSLCLSLFALTLRPPRFIPHHPGPACTRSAVGALIPMLPLPFLSPIWAQLTASPDAAWWVKALLWAVIWADPGQT